MSVVLMGKDYPATRIVRVQGSPYDMGAQHGKQLADLIRRAKGSAESSYKRAGFAGETLASILAANEKQIESTMPSLIEELGGIADGSGLTFTDILSIYLSPEILSALPLHAILQRQSSVPPSHEMGCTAFAAWGKATHDGSPILAQTRDSSPSAVTSRIVVIAKPRDGNSYVAHSRPTLNGGYGVNSEGVSLAAPTVYVSDSIQPLSLGQPSSLTDSTISKLVMERCGTVQDCLKYVASKPGGYMGLNILLLDTKGNAVKVERSYTSSNVETAPVDQRPEGYVLAATNHFTSTKMKALGPSSSDETFERVWSSYQRHQRIMQLLRSEAGKINLAHFVAFTRDHLYGPGDRSICRHGASICTNSAFVIQPRKRLLHLLTGTPCQNEYVPLACPA